MKLFARATAALAMLAAPPALAQGSGHLGFEYGDLRLDLSEFQDVEVEDHAFAGEGAVAFDYGGLGFQVDGSIAGINRPEAALVNLTGHFFFDGDNWRLGLVSGDAVFLSESEDLDEWFFGAEGQVWAERAAFSGSAVIGSAESGFSSELDAWNIDGAADFYITDNFVIGAVAGWGNLESLFDEDGIDTTSVGASAEYQFAGAPVSLHAGYSRFEIDDVDISSEAFTIGARWNWGGTLKQRDRAGFRHSPSGGILNRIYRS
jgi:hypothetical protein